MKWGKLAIINLYKCNESIKNKKKIKEFIRILCESINMKKVGSVKVKRFGKDKLKGYSAFQFIETSSIVCHFDETQNRAFIDIFSCRNFDAQKAENFAKKFFKAKKTQLRILIRG
jgi:S-adenosylmethionine/arginine decarboxylase-like enzyme